jgi:hypothetical protein
MSSDQTNHFRSPATKRVAAQVIIAIRLLTGCGSSSEEENKDEAAVNVEVTRISLNSTSCIGSACELELSAAFSDGTAASPSGTDLVASISEGPTAPAACDQSSTLGGNYFFRAEVTLKSLKPATKYLVRACLFRRQTATYSAGVVGEFTTAEK